MVQMSHTMQPKGLVALIVVLLCWLVPVRPTSAADFVVNDAGDAGVDQNRNLCTKFDPKCTLRAAIEQIRALKEKQNAISFSPAFSSKRSIFVQTPLPPIDIPVHISGLSIGSSCAKARLSKKQNFITLNGAGTGGGASGLKFEDGSQGSVVKGLAIVRFGGHGIEVTGSHISAHCNFIGVLSDGQTGAGNQQAGISISGAGGSFIGGETRDDRNIISGNSDEGVRVGVTGLTAWDTQHQSPIVVENNFIGTDEAGKRAIPGQNYGVVLATNGVVEIGQDDGNVISGNEQHGIMALFGFPETVTIRNNVIGQDESGSRQLSAQGGLMIQDAYPKGRIIGNLITWGSFGPGMHIRCYDCSYQRDVMEGWAANGIYGEIRGNKIGTNKAGTAAVTVANPAILIDSSSYNRIHDNLIVARGAEAAIEINNNFLVQVNRSDEFASHNEFTNNKIGTDFSGTEDLSLSATGIHLRAPNGMNVIRSNLIAAGGGAGVIVESDYNTIEDNHIGLELLLRPRGPNSGVFVSGTHNEIKANRIGHHLFGIQIDGGKNNIITANTIGSDTSGNMNLGNSSHGVLLENDAHGNTIGGTSDTDGNRFANNGGVGLATRADGSNIYAANLFDANVGQPIDNGNDGLDANDSCDQDRGPNDRVNTPVILSASVNGGVAGVVKSRPNRRYKVDVYRASACLNGRPQDLDSFLGSTEIEVGLSGQADFSVNTPGPHENVAAILTDLEQGASSEFSACFPAGRTLPSPKPNECEKFDDLLDNAKILQFHNQIIVGASIEALEEPVRIDVTRSKKHDLALKTPDSKRISDYFTVRSTRAIETEGNSSIVVGFIVPDGKSADNLHVYVLADPTWEISTDQTQRYWRWTPSIVTADGKVIMFATTFLPSEGTELALVEINDNQKSGTTFSSTVVDPFSTVSLPQGMYDPRDLYHFECERTDQGYCEENDMRDVLIAVSEAYQDFIQEEGFRPPKVGLAYPNIKVTKSPKGVLSYTSNGEQINDGIILGTPNSDGSCVHTDKLHNSAVYIHRLGMIYICKRDLLPSTVRHEYFHAIQGGYSAYGTSLSLWIMESTATLAENSARHSSEGSATMVPSNADYIRRDPLNRLRDSSLSLMNNTEKYRTQDFWQFVLEEEAKEFRSLHDFYNAISGGLEGGFLATFGKSLAEAYFEYTKNRLFEVHNTFDGVLTGFRCEGVMNNETDLNKLEIRNKDELYWKPGGVTESALDPGPDPPQDSQVNDYYTSSDKVQGYGSVYIKITVSTAGTSTPTLYDAVLNVRPIGSGKLYWKVYGPSSASSGCETIPDGDNGNFNEVSDHASFDHGQEIFIIISNKEPKPADFRIDFEHKTQSD